MEEIIKEKLVNLINEFKQDGRLLSFDESATKHAIILRVLQALGWDPFNIDEVYPEYSVGSNRVDYALRYNGTNKVFIEVKKVDEDLGKHQKQLLNYAFQEGVPLAVLTNGISWWFYLPLREGSWEQRKFYTIEIFEQDSEDVAEKFIEFLSKENVISDKAIRNAENLYKSRQKQHLIRETLPKAWKKIISEPDELLVELLADTTEKLCDHRPDSETVKEFLIKIAQGSFPQIEEQKSSFKNLSHTRRFYSRSGNYIGKSIVSFTFKGTKYSVRSWKELLIKITELMLSAHRQQFDKVLSLKGRKRPYFTKNPHELRHPERISNTDIYVETNLSANTIVKLSKSIISLFGYDENDLLIEVR